MDHLIRSPASIGLPAKHSLCAGTWEYLWLCGLILSFAYERPLWYATAFDRLNPRLFDVLFIVGIMTGIMRRRAFVGLPLALRIWASIVVVYCCCAAIWASLILPWEYGKYSIYFAGRYIQSLIVICMAASIPISCRQKRIMHYLAVLGGIFVAVYSYIQYSTGIVSIEYLEGQYVLMAPGTFLGPLDYGYFHLSLYSAVSCLLALALFPSVGHFGKILLLAVAVFVAWPALFCGSRAGLLLLGVGIPMLMKNSRRVRGWILPFALVVGVVLSVVVPNIVAPIIGESKTFSRLDEMESTDNSVKARLLVFTRFQLSHYMWQGASVPFIGAGFYVAPIYYAGIPKYRVGYGFHNAYLFALEQGGIGAFLLFIYFLVVCWRYLAMVQKNSTGAEEDIANGAIAIYGGMIFVGMVGLGFWLGFSTGYLPVYLMIIYFVAGRKSEK